MPRALRRRSSPRARPRPSPSRRRSTSRASSRRQLSAGRAERSGIVLAQLGAEDWPAAARIYDEGIAGGNATFEAAAPSWQEFSASRAGHPALVARADGELLGWAALSPVSSRAVYRGVGAVSVYVAPAHTGRGVGGILLEALIEASERAGFWTLEAGIFPENVASIALHERCGFTLVGVRRRVGQMRDGRWRDVLLYERRSATVGPG